MKRKSYPAQRLWSKRRADAAVKPLILEASLKTGNAREEDNREPLYGEQSVNPEGRGKEYGGSSKTSHRPSTSAGTCRRSAVWYR